MKKRRDFRRNALLLTCLRFCLSCNLSDLLVNSAVGEKGAHVMRINSNFLPSYSPATTSSLCSATFTSVTEAGGQLPALWPSTVSPAVRRQCKPTHTHFHTHTYTEEEPRLPRVNWGRGLAKRPWREAKVLRLGDKSYFSSAKPDRLNDHPRGANTSLNMHIREKRETYSTQHKSWLKNWEADRWHAPREHSSKNNVLFYHLKQFSSSTFFPTEAQTKQ